MNSVTIAQTEFEIAQLVKDIRATKLRTQTAGQITFLADYLRGYAREGEIVAKITDLNAFEIEAEIPVTYLGYIEDAKNIFGRGLDGSQLDMRLRVSLPVQNMRSATRTMRFSVVGSMPPALQADNAVIVMQVPTTGPTTTSNCAKRCGSAGYWWAHRVFGTRGTKPNVKLFRLGLQ